MSQDKEKFLLQVVAVLEKYGITCIDVMPRHENFYYVSEDYPNGRVMEKKYRIQKFEDGEKFVNLFKEMD